MEQIRDEHLSLRVAAAESRLLLAHNLMLGQLYAHGAWWRGDSLRKLWSVASVGDVEQLRALVLSGVAIDAQRPSDGMSALMLCCRGAFHIAAELLIHTGAQLDLRCHLGYTALHYACQATTGFWQDADECGRPSVPDAIRVIKALVEQGALLSPEARDGKVGLGLVPEKLLPQVRTAIGALDPEGEDLALDAGAMADPSGRFSEINLVPISVRTNRCASAGAMSAGPTGAAMNALI